MPLVQPISDELREPLQFLHLLEHLVHLIPIQAGVLVNQDIAKAGHRGEVSSEISRQYVELTQAQDRFAVVGRFAGILQGDDAMADVNAALRRDLKVALNDVFQVGVAVKLGPCPVFERLQSGQALAQFVQAPFDTAELGFHAHLLSECHHAAHAARADSRHSGP